MQNVSIEKRQYRGGLSVLTASEHLEVVSMPSSSGSAADESQSASSVTMLPGIPSQVTPMGSRMPVTIPPSIRSAHSSVSVNTPFLAAGLIPESLADILQVPESKEKETRRRINTKARVITGDEYVEELRN